MENTISETQYEGPGFGKLTDLACTHGQWGGE